MPFALAVTNTYIKLSVCVYIYIYAYKISYKSDKTGTGSMLKTISFQLKKSMNTERNGDIHHISRLKDCMLLRCDFSFGSIDSVQFHQVLSKLCSW